jgi:hypothetical protein
LECVLQRDFCFVKICYQETSTEDREDFIFAAVTVLFGMCGLVRLVIAVLKSVTRKRLLKTEDFVCCSSSDIWSVCCNWTVIVACGGHH